MCFAMPYSRKLICVFIVVCDRVMHIKKGDIGWKIQQIIY